MLDYPLEEQSKRRIDIFQRLLTTLVNVNEFSLKGQNYARSTEFLSNPITGGNECRNESHRHTKRRNNFIFPFTDKLLRSSLPRPRAKTIHWNYTRRKLLLAGIYIEIVIKQRRSPVLSEINPTEILAMILPTYIDVTGVRVVYQCLSNIVLPRFKNAWKYYSRKRFLFSPSSNQIRIE